MQRVKLPGDTRISKLKQGRVGPDLGLEVAGYIGPRNPRNSLFTSVDLGGAYINTEYHSDCFLHDTSTLVYQRRKHGCPVVAGGRFPLLKVRKHRGEAEVVLRARKEPLMWCV